MHAIMKHKCSFLSFMSALNVEMESVQCFISVMIWPLPSRIVNICEFSQETLKTGHGNISLWKVYGSISLHNFHVFNNTVLPKKAIFKQYKYMHFSKYRERLDYIMQG